MLNYRKLKQDFSSSILKEGRVLHEQKKVLSAKVLRLEDDSIRLHAQVLGNFDNAYESEIEIDRFESETIHSNCDCPYRYDCQHIAALVFFLEEKLDSLIVQYSKEEQIQEDTSAKTNAKLLQTIQEAKQAEEAKKDAFMQKQMMQEYKQSAEVLSSSLFFHPTEKQFAKEVELGFVCHPQALSLKKKKVEFQLALRLAFRSKPLQVVHVKQFLEAVFFEEPVIMGGRKVLFSPDSFDCCARIMMSTIRAHGQFQEDRLGKHSALSWPVFGEMLAELFQQEQKQQKKKGFHVEEEHLAFSNVYIGSLEAPLRYSLQDASIQFALETIGPPEPKVLLNPQIVVDQHEIYLEEALFFPSIYSGMIFQDCYYRFPQKISRLHLKDLEKIREMSIPEPLFGTFIENALPELKKYGSIKNEQALQFFSTLPYAKNLKGKCTLTYLDGELEAKLFFVYGDHVVAASFHQIEYDQVQSFVQKEGILARNLVEEKKLVDSLFQDFVFTPQTGIYTAKTEKKIVEFMTEIVPQYQDQVAFDCPQNLLDLFIYDDTTFALTLDYKDHVGYYTIQLEVKGPLKGVRLDVLWDCISAKRSFIELENKKQKRSVNRFSKILVLDLEKTTKLVGIFDELAISKIDNFTEEKPLWSLVTIDEQLFEGLPIELKVSEKLQKIRSQITGETSLQVPEMKKSILSLLRPYQVEGVQWLERLRLMYLNGILADDMGLGKTVQTITALSRYHEQNAKALSLIVCPTSLLYNWKEEIHRFQKQLQVMVVDGIPSVRKKVLEKISSYQVVITSYTLMQKDVETYKQMPFSYLVLDEAQHIKNRGTRNAKSVKAIQASHKLILTGTPIENALEEMWSLFDFLMPGFLSSYDRFVEKYLRVSGSVQAKNMEYLKRKVSPFILRRMKEDVLKDLPPVSEMTYHCQLSSVQLELYRSYAESARDELVKLVERDGFDKVQIHVLATLTRLKQICCHPAIFAKEKAEKGDSAKYDMLLELMQGLISGGHKTVIFSQYTKMLQIMKNDFSQMGISFSYLDGASKDRLEIVKKFNQDSNISVFLVSLKAGGTGLNLTGADTVIHYDMWWNPAVENQATDRVHRLGQKRSVSSYKLVTLQTIEEKIVEMQKRKKGLVKKVVSCDDEALTKLTWEEVLDLLQT